MDPHYSEYYNERGNLYMHEGRLAEALADYIRAIDLSSPYYEVFTNLGQCHRKMGQMEAAVAAYTRSLEPEPSHTLALLGRAQANEALAQRTEAIRDYTAAIEHDPTQWDALACCGVLFYETGRLEESLRDLETASLMNPKNVDICMRIAPTTHTLLLFVFAIVILCGLSFGLLFALSTLQDNMVETLNEAGPGWRCKPEYDLRSSFCRWRLCSARGTASSCKLGCLGYKSIHFSRCEYSSLLFHALRRIWQGGLVCSFQKTWEMD
jgi:tetratricopeptide (TPR) repeat protein